MVDASGRGSRGDHWLSELGFPAPAKQVVEVGPTYVSRCYRRTPAMLDGGLGGNSAMYPGQLRGGFVLAQEGDTFLASVSGALGETPPTDREGTLAWARALPNPDIAEVIGGAEPVGEAALMRFPAEVRHRYEDLAVPDGYVVLGTRCARSTRSTVRG